MHIANKIMYTKHFLRCIATLLQNQNCFLHINYRNGLHKILEAKTNFSQTILCFYGNISGGQYKEIVIIQC